MKKISLFILLFAGIWQTSHAQDLYQTIDTTYYAQMQEIFKFLDKSKVPHNLLSDYGIEFAPLQAFDGTDNDSIFVDYPTLYQLYVSLFSSRVDTGANDGLPAPETFYNNTQVLRQENRMVLTGLLYDYARFKEDAEATGKVEVVNQKIYDKYDNGIWQDPYEEQTCFALAPPISLMKSLDFSVQLPQQCFYTNRTDIVALYIDFDDGNGYVQMPFDGSIDLHYNTEGNKQWTYKLQLQDGSYLYSRSALEVQSNDNTAYQQLLITANKAYMGTYGQARITIDLAPGHNQITNPLIVAEGIDFGTLLAPELPNGKQDYSLFQNFVRDSDSQQLRDLIYEDTRTYDIIYVDWVNGVDYIQRNAYALEAVIEYVRDHKGDTGNNIVVLGQSMGGVVARYALADMEEEGINHATRLFVAHDAPMQGANVPLAVQYLYRDITSMGFLIAQSNMIINYFFGDLVQLLDLPAVKQLLKVDVIPVSISPNVFTPTDAYHLSFMNELKNNGLNGSNGYPVNCRNVAISNGSECGEDQGFQPGSLLFAYHTTGNFSHIQDLLMPLINSFGIDFDVNLYTSGVLTHLLENYGTLSTNVDGYALDYTNNIIYQANIIYVREINLGTGQFITVGGTLLNHNFSGHSNTPYDYYQGGYFSVAGLDVPIPDGIFLRDRVDFIPTPSALDIGLADVTLSDSDYKTGYVGAMPPNAPKNTPFDNFVTEFDSRHPLDNHNVFHASFTKRNGDWLTDEIQNTPVYTDCSAFCSGDLIMGSDYLCGSETYSIDVATTSVYWSITEGANLVSVSPNGSSAVITANNQDVNGYVTITADVTSSECGSYLATKRIWVGKSEYDIERDITSSQALLTVVPEGGAYYQNISSYDWALIAASDSNIQIIEDNETCEIIGYTGNDWWAHVLVTVTNSCGSTVKRAIVAPAHSGEVDCNDTETVNDIVIIQTGTNEYKIADLCKGEFEDINASELYDLTGYKVDDLFPVDKKVEVDDTQSQQTRIIVIQTAKGVKSKVIVVQ